MRQDGDCKISQWGCSTYKHHHWGEKNQRQRFLWGKKMRFVLWQSSRDVVSVTVSQMNPCWTILCGQQLCDWYATLFPLCREKLQREHFTGTFIVLTRQENSTECRSSCMQWFHLTKSTFPLHVITCFPTSNWSIVFFRLVPASFSVCPDMTICLWNCGWWLLAAQYLIPTGVSVVVTWSSRLPLTYWCIIAQVVANGTEGSVLLSSLVLLLSGNQEVRVHRHSALFPCKRSMCKKLCCLDEINIT